jgi:hypothetical protein
MPGNPYIAVTLASFSKLVHFHRSTATMSTAAGGYLHSPDGSGGELSAIIRYITDLERFGGARRSNSGGRH